MLAFFCFFTLLVLHFQDSSSSTVVVDGVKQWRNPTVQIGDIVIFQHKFEYKLYIFQNERTFSTCNFTQATVLAKPNSTSYTWHPSRTGFFYFSFNNGSTKACLEGQKVAFKVSLSASPPENPAVSPDPSPVAAPPLVSGGIVSSSPAFPWPFGPKEGNAPSPAPSLMSSATSPMEPQKSGFPFINSNPAVPLPTGEVDSATIRPFPTSSSHDLKVKETRAVQKALSHAILLLLLLLKG